MRVALFTEGTYPLVTGGVSTWCDHLIRGLGEHQFVPVTVVAGGERPLAGLPSNVTDLTLVPMWTPAPVLAPLIHGRHERRLRALLQRLWSAMLSLDDPHDQLAAFRDCLIELTAWKGPRLSSLLARRSSAHWIVATWADRRKTHPGLPPMTLADAASAAALIDRVLALADVRWPDVDLSHVASNGPPSLLALGRWWHHGTPIILTEHGIYLRERLIDLRASDMSWPARHVVSLFLRLLSQLTYSEARRLAPVSDFNRRWELRLGAEADKTHTIHNAVDAAQFDGTFAEPETPTVSFVGRIDPLKALDVLIEAFAVVRERLPEAKLRLFGPTQPSGEAYHASLVALIDRLGLGDAVTFEGRVDGALPAIKAGSVVALSSISEGLPYTVIEAMMAGRATVSTDVGGVSEIVGTDGSAGLLVPPRDPQALGEALLAVLLDPAKRDAMGRVARLRAQAMFDMTTFQERYRALYAEVAGPIAGPASGTLPDPLDAATIDDLLDQITAADPDLAREWAAAGAVAR